MEMKTRGAALFALTAVAFALTGGAAAAQFDPALEAKNVGKTAERKAYVTGTPAFQARMAQANAEEVGVLSRSSSTTPSAIRLETRAPAARTSALATCVSMTGPRTASGCERL